MIKSKHKRRATILLIVVSLLALLFVIITGFLTLSRNERQTLNEFRRGATTDLILENEKAKAVDAMQNQLKDGRGKVLSGAGAQPEDRLGGKGSYLSAEPVTSESVNLAPPPISPEGQTDFVAPSTGQGWGADYVAMKRMVYPQLSRLNPQAGDKPEPYAVWQLMFENDRDLGNAARRFDIRDVENAAREPAMDANGDGIPDSWWIYQIPSIEEANAIAGTPVQLSGYFSDDGNPLNDLRPYSIPPETTVGNPALDEMHRAFDRYRETARYDVATMVKSHGGMISLDAPRVRDSRTGAYLSPWNRKEAERMFDSFRSPIDTNLNRLAEYTPADRNYIFDSLAGASQAVELSLRRRGGLPPFGVGSGFALRTHAVPGILSLLQGDPGAGGGNWRGFPETFVPTYRVTPRNQSARAANWDLFNLAAPFSSNVGNDRYAAARSSQIGATEFFDSQQQGGAISLGSPLRGLNHRAQITLNNRSDELARKQIAGDQIPVSREGIAGNAREAPAASRAGFNAQLQFTPTDPSVGNSTQAANAGFTSPTYEGELKFPLGELAKGITFANDGRFRWQRYDGNADLKRGDALIERMARLYYDMLSGHTGWDETGFGTPTEVLSRRDQAFSLAVNTAAFMMPRSLTGVAGFVDVPTYKDGYNGTTYIGYGPQPYITEVVACVKYDPGSDQRNDLAVAVELFNPCDPYFRDLNPAAMPNTSPSDWQGLNGQPYDVFALNATQFAISFTPNPPPVAGAPPPQPPFVGTVLGGNIKRINGRCFYTTAFNFDQAYSPSDAFLNLPSSLNPFVGAGAPMFNLPQPLPNLEEKLNVYLWKKGIGESSDGSEGPDQWYMIDTVQLDISVFSDLPVFQDKYNFRSRVRDTRPNREFGGFDLSTSVGAVGLDTYGTPDGVRDTFARWNVVLPPLEDEGSVIQMGHTNGSPRGTLGNQRYYASPGSAQQINPDLLNQALPVAAPTVPLVLMNAGPDPNLTTLPLYERLNNLPMFGNQRQTSGNDPQQGDLRPRSFPTTGFMLFVPRYAHIQRPNNGPRVTASMLLEDEWELRYTSPHNPYGANGVPRYVADIGHMPIFDNNQAPLASGYFADPTSTAANVNKAGAGPLPWGLLVFDYFTTLDPALPGVDPLRVPGRININAAPWTTLSLLPVIGPALPPAAGSFRLPDDAGKYILPILRNWPTNPARVITDVSNIDVGLFDPSPSFWEPRVGVLAGLGSTELTPTSDPRVTIPPPAQAPDSLPYNSRLIHTDPYARDPGSMPEWQSIKWDRTAENATRWQLGGWLAAAAASYRDGVQYLAFNQAITGFTRPDYMRFADAYLRNPIGPSGGYGARYRDVRGDRFVVAFDDPANTAIRRYRQNTTVGDAPGYGPIRGAAPAAPGAPPAWLNGDVERPTQFGFISIGELANVKGFDSTRHTWLPPYPDMATAPLTTPTTLASGDFVKAVSILALLDSQMLTTRSNTFTTYVSVIDRKQPESSVRAEFIVDRSNILPRLAYDYRRTSTNNDPPLPDSVKRVDAMDQNFGFHAVGANDPLDTPIRWTAPPGLKPNIIAEKRIGYFNTRFDE